MKWMKLKGSIWSGFVLRRCTVCGRQFTRLSNLKAHMRTHSVERPFGCTVCTRRFTTQRFLTVTKIVSLFPWAEKTCILLGLGNLFGGICSPIGFYLITSYGLYFIELIFTMPLISHLHWFSGSFKKARKREAEGNSARWVLIDFKRSLNACKNHLRHFCVFLLRHLS